MAVAAKTRVAAIVLAAGCGRRMGADKALLDLAGMTAIERVSRSCHTAGAEPILVVRAKGAASLPPTPAPSGLTESNVVEVPPGEMRDSIVAGLAAVPGGCCGALVFPVDYALVSSTSVRAVIEGVIDGGDVVLPLFRGKPGHPIGLARSVFAELRAAPGTLRDVVRRDANRVRVVEVDDAWVCRDLDTPEDLAAARSSLRGA